MKNYYIRSAIGSQDYLSILGNAHNGFMVRIYRDLDGYEETIDDFMSTELFDSCLRTGYLTEMTEAKKFAIA